MPAEVVIVGDVSMADAELAADSAMMRVVHRVSCAGGMAALRDGRLAQLLLIELSGDLSPDEEALLDLVGLRADVRVIISFPLSVLDRVVACLPAPFATLLCAPDLTDRVAALGLAGLSVGSRVAETDTLAESLRLHKFTSEVARIARTLAVLADDAAGGGAALPGLPGAPSSDGGVSAEISAKDVRTMIRLRRQREALFGEDLFSDPVWDMLLDLAAAGLEGAQVAVSSLCIAAMVPPTTALRWIATLTAAGIIVRVPDPDDRRRVFLELSEAATATVLGFLAKAKGAGVTFV